MAHRELGSATHELVPVHEVAGAPRAECPRRGCAVLFSECQSCEHGTVLRLKGAELPYVVCESERAEPAFAVYPRHTVRHAMTQVVSVTPELPVERLVRTFIDEGIGAAPVVDGAGRVVGVVSRCDVCFGEVGFDQLRDAALSAWPEDSPRHDVLEGEHEQYVHDLLRSRTVADVMTPRVVGIGPDVPLSEAAELMAKTGLHHLPVLEDSHPVGMLGANDLAAWMAAHLRSA